MRVRAAAFLILGVLVVLPAQAGQVVFDTISGKILAAKNASEPRYPASITKLMTIYVAMEAIEAREIGWTAPIKVSKHAASAPPVRLGLRHGETIPLNKAIHAALTLSSNDAARVIADAVSGSETAFAKRMTATARTLGMRNTVFQNASGLPDRRQVTTAVDIAKLIAILDKRHGPRLRPLFRRALLWKGRTLRPRNGTVASPSGSILGKTGFTCDAGFTAALLLARAGKKTAIVTLANPGKAARTRAIAQLSKGRVGSDLKLGAKPIVLPRASCGKRSSARVASAPAPRRIKPEGWMISLGSFKNASEANTALARADLAGAGLPGLVVRMKSRPGYFALLKAPDMAGARTAQQTLRKRRVRARVLTPENTAKAGFQRR